MNKGFLSFLFLFIFFIASDSFASQSGDFYWTNPSWMEGDRVGVDNQESQESYGDQMDEGDGDQMDEGEGIEVVNSKNNWEVYEESQDFMTKIKKEKRKEGMELEEEYKKRDIYVEDEHLEENWEENNKKNEYGKHNKAFSSFSSEEKEGLFKRDWVYNSAYIKKQKRNLRKLREQRDLRESFYGQGSKKKHFSFLSQRQALMRSYNRENTTFNNFPPEVFDLPGTFK